MMPAWLFRDPPVRAPIVVLLTATVRPKGTLGASFVRTSFEQRLADYEEGLRFWLNRPGGWVAGIVFAENSAAGLDSLRKIADTENPQGLPVEFHSYDHPPTPEGLHYGYSEMVLVRSAVADSQLIRAHEYFLKATGRYKFPGVDRLLARLPPAFDIAVDCKLANIVSGYRHHFARVALIIFRRSFFENEIAALPEQMVPAPPWTRAQFVETALYDRIVALGDRACVIYRWPTNCEPSGVGANGDNYDSPRMRFKAGIRQVSRVLLPWLWL